MPKVSIFMSTRNRPNLLDGALASIVTQTEKDWNLIIIDDCSDTPQTITILEIYSKMFPNIKFERNRERQGPTIRRNELMLKADSKWLAILDDDDRWYPRYLEVMTMSSMPLVFCDAMALNEKGKYSYWESDKGKPILNIIPSIMLLDTEAFQDLGGWDLNLKNYHAEADYFIRIGGRRNMRHIHYPLATISISSTSMSKNTLESKKSLLYIVTKHHKNWSDKTRSEYWLRLGIHSIELKEKDSTMYFKLALRRNKFLYEAWIALITASIHKKLCLFCYKIYRRIFRYL